MTSRLGGRDLNPMCARPNQSNSAIHLTQIAQGASTVAFGYDSDSRRTSLTLPNGVTMSYNYDAGSQLLGVNYQLGNTLLASLTYGYDLAGRRTSVGGSYGQTNLPSALANASFDADNQLTLFGSSTLAYDANGNLVNDGTRTYTWDARNHLVSISGAVSASFQYDPFGRRVSKTIGAMTTNYLYDGVNPVQELSGGAPTANLLTGLGVDEYFQRTDANGPANFLTDALRSTIVLTGAAGNTVAQYTYDPYGNTTMTGSSSNPYQYTGRENDGTGLYYYRARYYSPQLGRFISEDPTGFASGVNLYRYVANSPLNLTDATGRGDPLWHLLISLSALRAAGYNWEQSINLAFQTAEIDFVPGSQGLDPGSTHVHSMAGRKPNGQWETPKQACSGTKQLIRDATAIGATPVALHAIEDAPFAAHRFKPWKGVLDPSFPMHFLTDHFPDPDVVANSMVNAYQYLSAPNQDPSNVLPSAPCQ
jgi:RHS repeat-associated protein